MYRKAAPDKPPQLVDAQAGSDPDDDQKAGSDGRYLDIRCRRHGCAIFPELIV